LERKIIEMLLLYGNEQEAFEDYVYKENDEGELVLEREQVEAKVYEKIYLDLQEDEIELTHELFRMIYYKLMEEMNEREDFTINTFMNQLDQDLISEISSILMEDEKYSLHQWERKNIYPKEKAQSVSQLVSETILTLRCYLIKKRIESLQVGTDNLEGDHQEALEEIIRYLELNKLLNTKLNRVLS
ncbi:MAG: DNA primase, partial [Bacteroidia bacterium]|nr:DNA primase [Bacteroidia bacterium]